MSGLDLEGVFDLHLHAGPDVRPRKTSAYELAAAAAAAGMGGLVLKRHVTSTVAEAAALRAAFPGLLVAGGVALNEATGGLNPAAVEAALAMGGHVVWLPTHDAAHERAFRGDAGAGITLLDGDGRLRGAARAIVELVAARGAALALGHVAPAEMRAVVAFGREVGVRCVLVSHPEIAFLDLPVAFQHELAGPDVVFERSYPRDNGVVDWDGLAGRIRAVGVETSALATDLGQAGSPHPLDGLREMLAALRARGFSDAELDVLARRNARRVLGVA
jgi:hypothetical protein